MGKPTIWAGKKAQPYTFPWKNTVPNITNGEWRYYRAKFWAEFPEEIYFWLIMFLIYFLNQATEQVEISGVVGSSLDRQKLVDHT